MASLLAAKFVAKNPKLVQEGLSVVEKDPRLISKFTGGGMMGPSMVGGGGKYSFDDDRVLHGNATLCPFYLGISNKSNTEKEKSITRLYLRINL